MLEGGKVCGLLSWTDDQWVSFEVRKEDYKRKVGAVPPSVEGSPLVMSTLQA